MEVTVEFEGTFEEFLKFTKGYDGESKISARVSLAPKPVYLKVVGVTSDAKNSKLHAIKELRKVTSLSLKDAKDIIEGFVANTQEPYIVHRVMDKGTIPPETRFLRLEVSA